MQSMRVPIEFAINLARSLTLTRPLEHLRAVQTEHVTMFEAIEARRQGRRATPPCAHHIEDACMRIFEGPGGVAHRRAGESRNMTKSGGRFGDERLGAPARNRPYKFAPTRWVRNGSRACVLRLRPAITSLPRDALLPVAGRRQIASRTVFSKTLRNILSASPLAYVCRCTRERQSSHSQVHAADKVLRFRGTPYTQDFRRDLNGGKQMSFRPRDRPRGQNRCDCRSRRISIERPLPLHSRLPPQAPVVRVVAGKPDRAKKRSGGTGKRGRDLAPCWRGRSSRATDPFTRAPRHWEPFTCNIERASRSTHSH